MDLPLIHADGQQIVPRETWWWRYRGVNGRITSRDTCERGAAAVPHVQIWKQILRKLLTNSEKAFILSHEADQQVCSFLNFYHFHM